MPPPAKLSRWAFGACTALIFGLSFFYYPKWKNQYTEATLSWDVSGYYLYLPAAFIYHDLKNAAFLDGVIEKYKPTPAPMQGFRHPSGGFVMKYSMGQALQYLPWFLVAHALAGPLGYPADGFSLPYQAAISWSSLLVALLGLYLARRNLLEYFSDRATALALLGLVLGANYLNYTAFDGAMTHNWLFTAYSALIFTTIRFYRRPAYGRAALIGLLLGWMALTRPTELVAALIPALWGIGSIGALRERLVFFRQNAAKIALAVLLCGAVGFLQLAYWKYVTGEWIVYSYENQGFNWLHPHVADVLFSYKAGWLVYSPLMVFGIPGLVALRRQHPGLFPAVMLFCLAFLYVVSAWEIWWYGGSLGMRAMVQSYAVWIFPLAAFAEWALAKTWRMLALGIAAAPCIWVNGWWTYQAHLENGFFVTEQMNRSLYWYGLRPGTSLNERNKLLDNAEIFPRQERRNVREIFRTGFENDTLGVTREQPVQGTRSLLLDKENQFSPEFYPPAAQLTAGQWLRTGITFQCREKEWEYWRMSMLIVRFSRNGEKVKDNALRLQRYADNTEARTVFLDTKVPDKAWDKVTVFFWNGDGDKAIRLDDLWVEVFE